MGNPLKWFYTDKKQNEKKKILVVEDDFILAEDLKITLTQLGYEVCGHTAKGDKAISMALTLNPDLILMDIKLKGSMDGTQAAVELRDKLRLPVIFISAHSDEKTLEKAKSAEPYGFLHKPINPKDIKHCIEIALSKARSDISLRLREEFFRNLAEYSCGWDFWIGRDGEVLYVSPGCEQITGYTRDEFIGRSDLLFEIVHPDDRESLREHLQAHIKLPEIETLEFRIYAKDGCEKWIRHLSRPLFGEEGLWVGLRANNIDITDQKRLEQKLARSAEILEDASGKEIH